MYHHLLDVPQEETLLLSTAKIAFPIRDPTPPPSDEEHIFPPFFWPFLDESPKEQEYEYESLPLRAISPAIDFDPSPTRQKVTVRKRTLMKLNDDSDSDVVNGPIEVEVPEPDKSKKVKRSFNPPVKEFLIRWLKRYSDNPYPSPRVKTCLAAKTGLTVNQIEDFLVNGKINVYV
jgi:hypothetical protein